MSESRRVIFTSMVAPLLSSIVRIVYFEVMSSMATMVPTRRTKRIGWLREK